MQDHIFRTYDIRGKVGSELDINQVRQVARALAFYYKQQDPSIQTIAVGMDGRIHSPALKKELVAGLQESGLNVIFIGVCPSPTLYFSQYWLAVDAALMITASHNPQEYNGIKICMRKQSVFGQDIQKILKLFKEKKRIIGVQAGTYTEHFIVPEYISFLKRLFPHLVGLDVNAVFDCGNGAMSAVLPEFIKQMEWKRTYQLCTDIDGSKAIHEADPTTPKNVQDLVQEVDRVGASFGIGFDGDGDRMGAVTSDGYLVPGDQLLTLYSQKILSELKHASVAFDIKCSSSLKEMITEWGGKPCVAPSGHSFIKQCMKENNAVVAGELSCHFFFHDRYFGFDDGLYAALRLIELLVESKRTLRELLKVIPHRQSSPELRIACGQSEGQIIVNKVLDSFIHEKNVKLTTIDGVRVDTEDGWGLIRASNTQPVICLRFESNSTEGLERIRLRFVLALKECFSSDFIKKQVTWPGI
jgi:phosphomannomutase/phosphoglucomutase